MNHTVELYHGTTLRAAERICEVGWQQQDSAALVSHVAAEHGVDAERIWADLTAYGRFLVVESDRGSVGSFCTSKRFTAARWAQRAPEALWELLWAVWRVKFSGQTELYSWNLDVAGHTWVFQQMCTEPLAVVTFRTTYEDLRALGARAGGFGSGPVTPRLLALPTAEVAVPLPLWPDRADLVVEPVERQVEWDVFARLLRLEDQEFIQRAEAGDFGPSGLKTEPAGVPGERPWWPWSVVQTQLTPEDAAVSEG